MSINRVPVFLPARTIKRIGIYNLKKVEDAIEVTRSRKSKDRQHNGKKERDKQRYTKHYEKH
jgi:hypothetical protein